MICEAGLTIIVNITHHCMLLETPHLTVRLLPSLRYLYIIQCSIIAQRGKPCTLVVNWSPLSSRRRPAETRWFVDIVNVRASTPINQSGTF